MSVLRLVQFTDPHLFGDETQSLRGVATLPALACALERARARDWPVDAILVTGDIVQDDPGGYVHFRRLFGNLGVPVLCLPGNHDDPKMMARALAQGPFVLDDSVDFDAWRIVLLDSSVAGSAAGRLSDASLATLEKSLATAGGRHVAVCLHHHPVPMASRWLDQVGLENANELWSIIDRHSSVRAVIWGHVHQRYEGFHKGVRLLATPATSAQFLPFSDDFAVDARPPAYRTLKLHADGSLLSEVVWVDGCAAGSSHSVCSAA